MSHSPIAHWWQYPTASPSAQFDTTNQLVRQLDAEFGSLPPDLQDAWEELSRVWGWSADCFERVFGVSPFASIGSTGKECYIAVNMSAWQQQRSFVTSPPVLFSSPGGDSLALNLPSDFSFDWFRVDGPTPVANYATVSVCALNHEPESGPAVSKYKYAFGGPIDLMSSFDLNPLRTICPGLWGVPYASIAVRIGDIGSAPFFGQRLGFAPPP